MTAIDVRRAALSCAGLGQPDSATDALSASMHPARNAKMRIPCSWARACAMVSATGRETGPRYFTQACFLLDGLKVFGHRAAVFEPAP